MASITYHHFALYQHAKLLLQLAKLGQKTVMVYHAANPEVPLGCISYTEQGVADIQVKEVAKKISIKRGVITVEAEPSYLGQKHLKLSLIPEVTDDDQIIWHCESNAGLKLAMPLVCRNKLHTYKPLQCPYQANKNCKAQFLKQERQNDELQNSVLLALRWPETESGTTIVQKCPGAYHGTLSMSCKAGEWVNAQGRCELAQTCLPRQSQWQVCNGSQNIDWPEKTTGQVASVACPWCMRKGQMMRMCQLDSKGQSEWGSIDWSSCID